MDLGLRGKRALVTASTTGTGFTTARALAIEAAQVTINGRSESRVGHAVEQLRTEVPRAIRRRGRIRHQAGQGAQRRLSHRRMGIVRDRTPLFTAADGDGLEVRLMEPS